MSLTQHACVLFCAGRQQQAAGMFLKAAQDGDAEGAFDYAHCLRYGIGIASDPAQAKTFFSFARDLDGGDASYNLAVMYMHGEGVCRDFSRAMRHMDDAAQMGNVEAQLYMGMAYTTGSVFEPDIVGIHRIPYHTPIFRERDALLAGQVLHDEEEEDARLRVISADGAQAFSYFREAACHADMTYVEELVTKAQYLYAKCYLDGFGVECNPSVAMKIMVIAGKNGSQDALGYLATHGVTKEMLEASRRETKRRLPRS